MSAAAARRRKQLAKKAAARAESGGAEEEDPVTLRLNALLADTANSDESTAYEALQLAQSQVRRGVKTGKYKDATDLAYTVGLALLEKHGRVSVASQLLAELVRVLNETHTDCTTEWIQRMCDLDSAYRDALERDGDMATDERDRLGRLHLKFLRSTLKWSEVLGTVRFGDCALHELLGRHCWRMSKRAPSIDEEGGASTDEEAEEADLEDYEEDEDISAPSLRCEAVTHLALSEKPDVLAEHLKTLPPPTPEEIKSGHACPPGERDALLTRSVLVLAAVENLRDANTLLRSYMSNIEDRDSETLRKSYMDKTDGVAPSHVIFCSMLLRTCEKSAKTGPLYSWLLRSFNSELSKMYKPDIVKAYTTKIGKVYFNIQPPPSMMSTLENMMSMMGGHPGGGGGGPPMNPLMMQQMMQQMQGGM